MYLSTFDEIGQVSPGLIAIEAASLYCAFEKVEEIVYGFTNLPRRKAGAMRLLELNQKHWSIENRLHYRRDVTLGEDYCQVRNNGAPQSLAALNRGVLAFMDWLGVTNVAVQMRHFCAQPQEILQLLLGKLSRQGG